MTEGHSKIGKRVTIAHVFHSHARTRAYRHELLGREGVIVAVLRNGKIALVELDGDQWSYPAGVRRWSIAWDDLQVETTSETPNKRALEYRAGFSWKGRQAVQHAVPPGETGSPGKEVGLCGHGARPLPTCGWSVNFCPTAKSACPACVRLAKIKISDRGNDAEALLAS
ncbi:hypothetical protein [Nonomuraea basaltis]|uniref:hypothetical protein n=1 Tax=Nonomuraea basaltis TaxID=2495887 RepID=UPI00110C52BD|nr:hypothetical protein [Nonomuraea basaltis]TMR96812.1 hypothetical protein EJK15_21145 [Nonomuraea basaltis]